jgi:hypothetical protein
MSSRFLWFLDLLFLLSSFLRSASHGIDQWRSNEFNENQSAFACTPLRESFQRLDKFVIWTRKIGFVRSRNNRVNEKQRKSLKLPNLQSNF